MRRALRLLRLSLAAQLTTWAQWLEPPAPMVERAAVQIPATFSSPARLVTVRGCGLPPARPRTACTCRNPYAAGGLEQDCPVHGVPTWLQPDPFPTCSCVPYPYGDGPERDCPVHGDGVE